jgi:hypothetical protein
MSETIARPDIKRKKGWFTINVGLGNDNEPRKIFVGANGQDFLIERGKDVDVPREVLNTLDDAVVGVDEIDEQDPNKVTVINRKRFPYTIVAAL